MSSSHARGRRVAIVPREACSPYRRRSPVLLPSLLVVAQLAATLATTDSIYSSSALREFVARASERNRRVPATLAAYGASAESEIALAIRRPDGVELSPSIEQVRSEIQWTRGGRYEQHVVAYRSQQTGFSLATIGLFRSAWSVPMLYGNRIALYFDRDSTRRTRSGSREARSMAVHPFAADRESYYRYEGGDTVAVLRTHGREIPLVRVTVEPRITRSRIATLLFRGEVDVDAVHGEIVRMRGYFVSVRPPRSLRARLLALSFEAVAFVELENAEIEGRYWLPTYQRIEAQAAFLGSADQRSILRIISRFRDYRVNGGSADPLTARAIAETDTALASDTLAPRAHRLTFATRDSLDRPSEWSAPLGAVTASAHADDFDDLAPDVWRDTGPPRVAFSAPRFSDLARFDRVEGLFTGAGVELRLRDRLPGATVRATAGWAWSEGTARGRVEGEWRHGDWVPSFRAGRSLEITNDFLAPFDSGTSVLDAAFLSIDDNDYVDRRSAAVALTRLFGARGKGAASAASLRVEAGVASDGGASASVSRGYLFHPDSLFRPNRGVRAGRYARTAIDFHLHPDVDAEFVRPGLGAALHYERGDGGLRYQRAEARLVARENRGALTLAARVDAGALWGASRGDALPPQQLFELGQNQHLPGYDYKEFAGDRAAVARALLMRRLPLWRAPIHVWRRVWLPAPTPALAVGAQSGWTAASSDAARRAILLLGAREERIGGPAWPPGSGTPLSRSSDGIRSSVEVGLRFFGGSAVIGLARAVDHAAPWRWRLGFSQGL